MPAMNLAQTMPNATGPAPKPFSATFGGVGATPLGNPGQSVTSGIAPMQQGYNQALQSLQQSLQASNNTTSGAMNQLGQQLQQNQGNVQQGLINRGLDNTTVSQTMQQAPLQTYNQGALNVQNAGAERQMQAYNSLAGMQAQGGAGLSNYLSPFLQSNLGQQALANQTTQNQFQNTATGVNPGFGSPGSVTGGVPQQQALMQQIAAMQMAQQPQGQQQAAGYGGQVAGTPSLYDQYQQNLLSGATVGGQ